ncbi:hypothetical protein B566_EDAN015734 [Ephemera danica]|nr:hypothetical protein B566_EDAN015734 [Ephemera danica]
MQNPSYFEYLRVLTLRHVNGLDCRALASEGVYYLSEQFKCCFCKIQVPRESLNQHITSQQHTNTSKNGNIDIYAWPGIIAVQAAQSMMLGGQAIVPEVGAQAVTQQAAAPPCEPKCCICLVNAVNTVQLECGHACCCRDCIAGLLVCPLCRKEIRTFAAPVFFS